MESGTFAPIGRLTKRLVKNLGPGRQGDRGGLYLVVDSTANASRRWIMRVTVKAQRNKKGAPLRTDFGSGGADVVTLNKARADLGISANGKTGA